MYFHRQKLQQHIPTRFTFPWVWVNLTLILGGRSSLAKSSASPGNVVTLAVTLRHRLPWHDTRKVLLSCLSDVPMVIVLAVKVQYSQQYSLLYLFYYEVKPKLTVVFSRSGACGGGRCSCDGYNCKRGNNFFSYWRQQELWNFSLALYCVINVATRNLKQPADDARVSKYRQVKPIEI